MTRMANLAPNPSQEPQTSKVFAIHEDMQDQDVSEDCNAGLVSPASNNEIVPLSTTKLSNMQRTSYVSSPEKSFMFNNLDTPPNPLSLYFGYLLIERKGKGYKILPKNVKHDDETEKSLLKALEMQCNMPIARNPTNATWHKDPGGASSETYISKTQKPDTSKVAIHKIEASGIASESAAKDSKITIAEVEQLRQQLAAAKQRIAAQEEKLAKSRNTTHPRELLSASRIHPGGYEMSGSAASGLNDSIGSLSLNGGGVFGSTDSIPSYSTGMLSHYGSDFALPQTFTTPFAPNSEIWASHSNRNWGSRASGTATSQLPMPQSQQMQYLERDYPTASLAGPLSNRKTFDESELPPHGAPAQRATVQGSRNSSNMSQISRSNVWDTYSSNGLYPAANFGPSYSSADIYQPESSFGSRQVGMSLSATANEFTAVGHSGPWNAIPSSAGHTYIPPTEPLNYRRLLDRSVSCNWKYIVDKIVCNNDQQASIFLQQKLKLGTAEQKYEIVEAIVSQAYPLMINRFGNFLVQRCFEHGTPEQVIAIANAIRGNTLTLSMDAFGCHVVQKAFDSVPEEYKAVMVHELLRRIPETVIHRYACHVWQKLFELRWSDSPPQIMKYVNEALRGMWHEVALGETGSLVVQNIFENCLEEDKRPCINEVLNSIDVIAHGQFGNWCIQHICEHGAPADRSRAIDHVLRFATEYSTDQFASKVVEKCLKIGNSEFLERYLERVCEGRLDRPRIPLIDIASDQYGNYLIQYILLHANSQHREIVASHIKKHMVSLRGSKFGSRVGMLCSNPAYATRPGPGPSQGPANSSNRFANSNPPTRFSGNYR